MDPRYQNINNYLKVKEELIESEVEENVKLLRDKTQHMFFRDLLHTEVGRLLGDMLNVYNEWEGFAASFLNPSQSHGIIERLRKPASKSVKNLFIKLSGQQPSIMVPDVIDALWQRGLWQILSDIKEELLALAELLLEANGKQSKIIVENSIKNQLLFMKSEENKPQLKILLTFREDGRRWAHGVKRFLERPSEKCSYTVFTLEDFRCWIFRNPQIAFPAIMKEVDYVVPILTQDYFKMLNNNDSDLCGRMGNCIDEAYAYNIYNVLSTEYAVNGLKNFKVRCLWPNCTTAQEIRYQPMLTAFCDNLKKLKDMLPFPSEL